jgi:hypothetical protein
MAFSVKANQRYVFGRCSVFVAGVQLAFLVAFSFQMQHSSARVGAMSKPHARVNIKNTMTCHHIAYTQMFSSESREHPMSLDTRL